MLLSRSILLNLYRSPPNMTASSYSRDAFITFNKDTRAFLLIHEKTDKNSRARLIRENVARHDMKTLLVRRIYIRNYVSKGKCQKEKKKRRGSISFVFSGRL